MFCLGQSEPKEFNFGTSVGILGGYFLKDLALTDKVAERGGYRANATGSHLVPLDQTPFKEKARLGNG